MFYCYKLQFITEEEFTTELSTEETRSCTEEEDAIKTPFFTIILVLLAHLPVHFFYSV